MADYDNATPAIANSFQAGNTCPACQRLIEEKQPIVICVQCGGLHHEMCWTVQGGCCSYHCDKRTQAVGALQADVVVNAAETEKVVLPPVIPQRKPEEVARLYLPEKPKRLSLLAIAAIVTAGICSMAIWGALEQDQTLTILGLASALTAIVTGITALVIIYSGGKAKGLAAAGVAIGCAGAVVLVTVSILAQRQRSFSGGEPSPTFTNDAPSEEELNRLDPVKAKAFRANVVITAQSGGLGGAAMLSSGTILMVVDKRAFILTNRHSVGQGAATAKRIEVLFYNGERSTAMVEWLAPGGMDAAVLSCQALTLPPIEPAKLTTELLPQGERVFALGNPTNLRWSYSEGVICATRSQKLGNRDVPIYQTQAPIRLGSSGGGLYDMKGTLIGINTWTEDKSTREGLAFAVSTRSVLEALPAEESKRFLEPAPQGGMSK